jgi:hypothetical protein
MNMKITGGLAGLAAVSAVLSGVIAGPAHAAGPFPREDRIPSQVSCGSPAAWLKLSSLIVSFPSGRTHVTVSCYTGDGTSAVAVPQVERAAVTAGHAACLSLYQNGWVHRVCIAGRASRDLDLPSVTRVELSTQASSPPT